MTDSFLELLRRPVPGDGEDSMLLDVPGLVESLVMSGEDWLARYGHDWKQADDVPLAAFEAIESCARLLRCDAELLAEVQHGDDVLRQLQQLLESDAELLFHHAIAMPAWDAWLTQANALWDQHSEDAEAAITLLSDAEAVSFLFWFGETHDVNADDLLRLETHQSQWEAIQTWIGEHALFFILCEGHVRAAARSIRGDMDRVDPSGWLSLSSLMYLALLDAADDGWRLVEEPVKPAMPRLIALSTLQRGAARADYLGVPVAYGMAAGTASPTRATSPFVWRSPDDKLEARLTRPAELSPAGTTKTELDFFAVHDSDEIPAALIGQAVQLGEATGQIRTITRGDFELATCVVVYERIIAGGEPKIDLRVGGQVWASVELES